MIQISKDIKDKKEGEQYLKEKAVEEPFLSFYHRHGSQEYISIF